MSRQKAQTADRLPTAREEAVRGGHAAQGQHEEEGQEVIAVHSTRKGVIAFVLAAALAPLCAANASASEPWWGVTIGAQPTNVQSGLAADEVQHLTISATAGDVALIEPKSLTEVELELRKFEELRFAVVPYDTTAAQMQAALESIYLSKQVR